MLGLMTLYPSREIVGKKSEYKTKEAFVEAIAEEECKEVDIDKVGTALMRYYPKGTESSQWEFGEGVGVYMCVDKKSRGTFEVWIV